jgi:hypothetical protein
MQIGSIPSIPAIDAATPASATTQSHGSGSGKTGSAVTAETSATAASGVAASGVSANISPSKGASQSQPGVLSPLDAALAAVYTTSVAGHDYLGMVQQTAGEYVASAADPPAPPITGTGSSIQAAENNLTVVIDEMV